MRTTRPRPPPTPRRQSRAGSSSVVLLETADCAEFELRRSDLQRVYQRSTERGQIHGELVAGLRFDAVGATQRRGSEKMQVYVPGPAMRRVLEVVVFEVRQRMAHVCLAGQEWLFPEQFTAAPDATIPFQMRWQPAGPKFRPDRALAQLRVGEVQVVLSFGDVVREFVADRKPQTIRHAPVPNYVQADQLGFFASVQCKMRRAQWVARAHHDVAVALVEPFGLHSRTVSRPSALESPLEHAHGIRDLRVRHSQFAVHDVTSIRAAQVRETG